MCGTTSPSSIYPDLGGVMGWEINYDAVGSIRPEKGQDFTDIADCVENTNSLNCKFAL